MMIYIYGDLPEQAGTNAGRQIEFFTQTNTTIKKNKHPIYKPFNQMITDKLFT